MKRATEQWVFSGGCLIVPLVCCGLAFLAQWVYLLAAGCLLAIWLYLCRQRVERDNKTVREEFRRVFAVPNVEVPQLKIGGHYGFPLFTLTFKTAAALQRAEQAGCLAAFKLFLQGFYEHAGSRRNPFDAERAVWATYQGWRPS